jgi:transcriptional regulator with XRE-family HTH domain
MQTSAKDIVDWVRASICSLALNPEYGTKDAVYNALAEASGLSKSMVMKFDQGQSMNPRADTLDKLSGAVKLLYSRLAA